MDKITCLRQDIPKQVEDIMDLYDKKKMLGTKGTHITQSLFLEVGYDTRYAIFTMGEDDHVYKGNTYLSLKKLYLAMEDVTEYEFATTYFLSWNHWQRITKNKSLVDLVADMREELELKLRARAIKDIISNDNSFQATKWIADKGWGQRPAGRPKKGESEREANMVGRLKEEFDEDIKRMRVVN